ncbi:uncharacterized protein LOC128214812 isoform X1 [Mya arenaria]|uniref:uncharacterized protein LOC128214812 isoform X1 n=1 Tax=Mya arenaria TaxID=6604 RepID=UPI0022E15DC9|nr:uncharacterized protein LOC128214812 isoform X1 [Mya arenaria]XP_052777438.1 uncharacterized protein LOC128214812 isoform X1 [Mya arenaria]
MADAYNELSERVCEVLDHLGYSESIVMFRREIWRQRDLQRNSQEKHRTRITAGSKMEGFSAPCESDTDYVFLDNYTVCALVGDTSHTPPESLTALSLHAEQCSPGHFWLELKHTGSVENMNIQKALFIHEDGRKFLSSYEFRKSFILNDKIESISGPALTKSNEYHSWDHVFAFRCTSQQQLLMEWASRPRPHGWPSPGLVREVLQQDAQIVPVGCKSSGNKDVQWRACFIPSEKKLSDSWNEFQYKMYILLKFLKKTELKPISDEMSSYLMKNVMFWFVEGKPLDVFTKSTLLVNVQSCLKMFLKALKDNHLSYYMIPGRNLLTGRISPQQRHKLIVKLDELIQEGPRIVFRCPRVVEVLQLPPSELEGKGCWRDKLERLFRASENIGWSHWRPGMTREEVDRCTWADPDFTAIKDLMADMVWPQWRQHQEQDMNEVLYRKVADALS